MRKIIFLTLVLVLALTACGPETQSSESASGPVATNAAPATSMPTDVPAEPAATEAASATQAELSTEAPPVTVTPRAEMEATNPGTVVLASGQPQLIEFFAFW